MRGEVFFYLVGWYYWSCAGGSGERNLADEVAMVSGTVSLRGVNREDHTLSPTNEWV